VGTRKSIQHLQATGEMKMKSTLQFHLTPIRMAIIKKTTAYAGEDMGRKESFYIEMQISPVTITSLQETKNRITMSSN
jgi:hypothetical protein